MKYCFLALVAFAAILTSCNSKPDPAKKREAMRERMDSLRHDLLNTDIEFSKMSEEKGRNNAFVEYAGENATFLRPFSMPVTGKDTIVELFKAHPDSQYILTWMPIRAEVAHSGDLGFTYGTYSLEVKGMGKEEGTYCTIWKKDKNKMWKWALDTGNEGLKMDEKAEDKVIDDKRYKEREAEGKKKG